MPALDLHPPGPFEASSSDEELEVEYDEDVNAREDDTVIDLTI
eukprot:COSAG01_NODE_3400_length_6142_cov_8.459374_9_plen_43_part_00